jgi:hypothetical protein
LRRKLEQSLILNAFADHFLADSFAAGHIRVDRKRLSDRVAKKLHDEDNRANAGTHKWWVSNAIGETWWPVGDGKWKEMNEPDKRRIIEAVRESIVEVIGVYLTVTPLIRDGSTSLKIPDIQFFIGRLFYSMDVNLEFGYGSFVALRPGTDPAGPATIGAERGAKIGLSAHYAFF